jgi:hypothetical protein
MSYFVGAEAMENAEFEGEDAGFAINGGKGWKKVRPRRRRPLSCARRAIATLATATTAPAKGQVLQPPDRSQRPDGHGHGAAAPTLTLP